MCGWCCVGMGGGGEGGNWLDTLDCKGGTLQQRGKLSSRGEPQQQRGTYLLLRPVDEFFIYIFCLLETKTNLPQVVTRAVSHVGLYMDQAVL